MELSKSEERYILGLIEGKTQRQAYLAAFPQSRKWKPETVDSKACTLFASKKVRERYGEILARIVKEAEAECIVSVKGVLQDLLETKEICLGRKAAPIVVGGEVVTEKVFNANGANKTLELIGKHLGMFERREPSGEEEPGGKGILILPEVQGYEPGNMAAAAEAGEVSGQV